MNFFLKIVPIMK